MNLVTIWRTYGPYHLARVEALSNEFGNSQVICFSHCDIDSGTYPFFNLNPANHRVISHGEPEQISFIPAIWRTYKLLRDASPHLILTCGYERPETLGALIYARHKKRTVFLMLDNQYDDRERKWLVEFVKKYYLKFFHGFVYGGDTHKDYLRKLDVPLGREVHGYNCVDNDRIRNASTALRRAGIKSEVEDYFLCVSRFVEKKNIPFLVREYSRYREKIGTAEAWKLVLVGDGAERGIIEDEIRNCGLLENVKIIGRVDNFDEIIRWLAFARAFVLPSKHNEQWGLVVNEAMAAGLPVLVSKRCGCASSLVEEGLNGFAFNPEVKGELTNRMVWMHLNSNRLSEMGWKSLAIIEDYSPQRFAQKVKWLYEMIPNWHGTNKARRSR